MKRESNLIEKIADPDNLRLAFHSAHKGKSAKAEVIAYRNKLDQNLLLLREQILSGNVDVGHYHSFKIYEPKERTIVAASFGERVLHHALINLCKPRFEKHLIYQTYACRTGKGTHAALSQAMHYSRKFRWYLKLDYRKYFDNINHEVLNAQLERIFKDAILLEIFRKIIASHSIQPGVGLPIGNLTSQYLANHYLSSLDHFVKEELNASGYVRYMDDLVLWSNTREHLQYCFQKLAAKSENELQLSFKPEQLNTTKTAIPFLGFRLWPNRLRLTSPAKKRFRKKLQAASSDLNEMRCSQGAYQTRVLSLVAHNRIAQSKSFRISVLNKMELRA